MNPITPFYQEIEKLSRALSVKSIYVFGSVLHSKYNQESDIDFLISFDENLSYEDYTENYFILHEKLGLLLKRKIDLVTQRSLKNPILIEEINRKKELIYAS